MKANNKYLVFVAVAFIALSACQQDESLTQRPQGDASVITFNSPYTIDSRSDAMRSGSFETGDKVGVLGYCMASNQGTDYSTSPWDTKKPFCTPDVFYNQMLEYNGTGAWDYSWTGTFDGEGPVGTLHPWSKNEDDTFSFFAYYPYAEVDNRGVGTIKIKDEDDKEIEMGEIELSASNHRGDPTITYTMPFDDGGTTTSQRRWWWVPDFMLAYKTDHLKQDGSVSLNFRHIFSALEFEINNLTNEEIIIEDLYFGGGTEDNDTRTAGFYREVSVTGQQSGYTVDKSINNTFIGEFQLIGREADEDEHMLIDFSCQPNTTTPIPITYNGSPISLLFIPDENGALTTDNNASIYIRMSAKTVSGTELADDSNRYLNLINMTFRPGVRNIFSINFIGNDFYIQMRSDGSWSDGGDSDIVFE